MLREKDEVAQVRHDELGFVIGPNGKLSSFHSRFSRKAFLAGERRMFEQIFLLIYLRCIITHFSFLGASIGHLRGYEIDERWCPPGCPDFAGTRKGKPILTSWHRSDETAGHVVKCSAIKYAAVLGLLNTAPL